MIHPNEPPRSAPHRMHWARLLQVRMPSLPASQNTGYPNISASIAITTAPPTHCQAVAVVVLHALADALQNQRQIENP